MDNLQGRILSVSTEVQGSIAVSWADNTMSVTNAADFSRAGGFFTFDNGATVYQYTEVIESEDPDYPDAVTTVQVAPDNFEAETLAAIWPPAVDVYAELALDDSGDSLTVEVPHNLRALLVDGIREPEQQESALAQFVEGRWILADVTGELASIQTSVIDGLDDQLEAMEAAREADKAENDQALADAKTELTESFTQAVGDVRGIANGKNRTYWSAALPGDTEGIAGDTWFVTGEAGSALEVWRHDGSSWVRSPIDGTALVAESVTAAQIAADAITAAKIATDAVTADKIVANAITANKINSDEAFANLISANIANFAAVWAGKITANSLAADAVNGKTLSGVDIYSPNSTATPRVHLGKSILEVIRRGDANDPEYTSLSLGGNTSDRMQLLDLSGNVVCGFDENGNGTANDFGVQGEFSAPLIRLGDEDLLDLLAGKARGVVPGGWWKGGTGTAQIKFGNSEYGLYEMPVFLPGGRFYSIKYTGLINASQAGFIFLKYRFTSSKSGSPGAPKVTSPIVGAGTFPVVAGYNWIDFDVRVPGWTAEGWYRILFTGQSGVAGMTGQTYGVDANPASLAVIDEGPQVVRSYVVVSSGGGTPPTGQTNTDPVEVTTSTYDRTWTASWVRSWQGGNIRTDYARQGYYGGSQNYSMLGIPQAMIDALKGSSISRLEVTLANKSFYYGSGGKARFALAPTATSGTAISAPSTYSSNSVTADSALWTAGTSKTTGLPASFFGGFKNGNVGAITLGEGAGSNMTYYGKFSNALSTIKFRAIYEK